MYIEIEKQHTSIDYYRRQEWHRWLYDRLGDSYEARFIYENSLRHRIFIAEELDMLAFRLKFGL